MAEEIVAEPEGKLQPVQEGVVGRRQAVPEDPLRVLEALGLGLLQVELDPVAEERGVAAEPDPALGHVVATGEGAQPDVVVPQQIDRGEAGQRCGQQMLDHPPALEAAVDIVAEIDHHLLQALAGRSGIGADLPLDRLQEVDPAVDVADAVDANSDREPRRVAIHQWSGGSGFPSTLEQALQHRQVVSRVPKQQVTLAPGRPGCLLHAGDICAGTGPVTTRPGGSAAHPVVTCDPGL